MADDILQQKRKERNPFSRLAPYELTCPEMKTLLHWCGPELISEQELPWGGGNWSKIKTQIYIMYKIIIRK